MSIIERRRRYVCICGNAIPFTCLRWMWAGGLHTAFGGGKYVVKLIRCVKMDCGHDVMQTMHGRAVDFPQFYFFVDRFPGIIWTIFYRFYIKGRVICEIKLICKQCHKIVIYIRSITVIWLDKNHFKIILMMVIGKHFDEVKI